MSDYDGGSVVRMIDGGILVAGYSYSTNGDFALAGNLGGADAYIAKVNASGTSLDWLRTIRGTNSDYGTTCWPVNDGGFILAGHTYSQDNDFSGSGYHNGMDAFLVKLLSPSNTITVTRPNGGEDWSQGSSQTIQWSYSGDNLVPGPGELTSNRAGDLPDG